MNSTNYGPDSDTAEEALTFFFVQFGC